jgi:hypothetical protein
MSGFEAVRPICLAVLAAAAARPVLAQEAVQGWSFELTPYLFAASMDGTAAARGVEAKVDVDFDTLLDNLDSAFMGQFEARRGRWGFDLEGIYFKLDGEPVTTWSGPLGNSNVAALDWTATEQVYQWTIFYGLLSDDTKVDVLAAARYTDIEVKLALSADTGSPLLPSGARSVGRSEDWIDPVIGVRVLAPISARWSIFAYGDVGGGLGSGSDLTYQLFGALRWQFAERWRLQAGYRYVYQDYANGDFKWDVVTSGPQLGLTIQW